MPLSVGLFIFRGVVRPVGRIDCLAVIGDGYRAVQLFGGRAGKTLGSDFRLNLPGWEIGLILVASSIVLGWLGSYIAVQRSLFSQR